MGTIELDALEVRLGGRTILNGLSGVLSGQAIGLGQATFRVTPGVAVRPIVGDPLWASQVLVWQKYGPLAELAPMLIRAAKQVYQAAVDRSPALLAWRA